MADKNVPKSALLYFREKSQELERELKLKDEYWRSQQRAWQDMKVAWQIKLGFQNNCFHSTYGAVHK